MVKTPYIVTLILALVVSISCSKKSSDDDESVDLPSTSQGAVVVSGSQPVQGTTVIVSSTENGPSQISVVGGNTVASANPKPPVWEELISDATVLWGDPIAFTAEAKDPNPEEDVTYSLKSSAMTCDDGVWTTAIAINATTGILSGTPSEVDQGSCTITVKATSGSDSIEQTFTLTISSTPAPPYWDSTQDDFVQMEDVAVNKSLHAKDSNYGDVVVYSLDLVNMTCDNGTWSPNIDIDSESGELSGTPRNADVGTCTVKVDATSGGETISHSFTITIANTNDPPVWDATIADFNQDEDDPLAGVIASATDEDAADTPVYSLDATNMTCDDGSWAPNIAINAGTGELTGTPTNADVGSCTVKIVATSNSQSIEQTFTITVDNTNDILTWTPTMSDFSHVEGATLESASRYASATDVDPGSSIAYAIVAFHADDCDKDSDWTVALDINSSTGQLLGTPSNANVGTCNIRITATSDGETINDDVEITVTAASAPPYWDPTPSNQSVNEDASLSYTINATDPNADPVSYSLVGATTTCDTGATWSTPLAINSSSGEITGTPTNADVGTCNITVRSSAGGDNITNTFTLTINNTPDAPTWQTAVSDFNQEVGSAISGKTVTAVDVDAGDTPSYSLDFGNMTCDDGSFSPQISVHSTTGVISGTPQIPDLGSCSVRVRADSGVDTIYTTFNITTTPTSNPPTDVTFSSAAGAIVAGECVSISVRSIDSAGYPANVGSDETVTLNVNNGTGTYYTTNACSTSTTTATITSGNFAATVYFSSVTAPQSLTLIGISPSYNNAYLPINVGSSATELLIEGAAEIKQNECSKFTVSRIDTYGNKIGEDNTVLIDLTEDNNATFYSDSSCTSSITQTTIVAESSETDIYVLDGTIETVVLTATDNAASLTADSTSTDVVTSLTWWNTSWQKRVRIAISNLDQTDTFTNIPVRIKLDSTVINYTDFKTNGDDLAFLADDHSTQLDFDIDVWNTSGDSYIWVKVGSLIGSSAENYIYLYYNNASATSTENASNVWTDYFGVWHLQEDPTSGAPQYEDGTGSNDGTATNSPTQVTAVVGNGMGVSGSNDTIDTGTDLSVVIGASSTFSVWLKTNQTGNNTMWQAPGITGVEQAGGGNDIFFGWIDGSGNIGVTAGNGAAAKSNFVVNDNVWRHITITRDVGGAVQFFVNGVKNNTASSEAGAKTSYFSEFGIIGDTGGTPEDLNGSLDEIHVFSGVQTDARIKADYKYQTDSYFTFAPVESL